ncbi:TonB-dependent receptor [Bacteroides sp. 519]|uniref:SusC/RagA family TonB-linked outer membrane protein n=1 Tax=Bacteroides sp. 519 TaxID=2302937 RepID=UPI0013D733D3|nr:TonB-dependent receptor [Bacteroides sp. 519]NDV57854.1 TonB-dependent receptor [Bacteroides sp. 519]
MKSIILTITLLLLPLLAATAQIKIQGTVTDGLNEPLIGVNILEKGTQNGVITDINGQYTITVAGEASEITFSYIAYKTVTQRVGQQRTINVTLHDDTEMLDEVVVVGFGVVKKSDLTSSIASVKGSELKSMSVGNANQSLQGKAAGVQIISAGNPGGQPKVLIRGFSTVSLSTDPLYVVDGVPISGGINFLNPNEIESMEVLKDASASAIYGSRASNGVIMVSTRKGKEGKPTFSLDLSYGFQEMKNPYNMADAQEYAEILNTAALNAGYPKEFDNPADYAGKTTDWWGAGIRKYSPQMNMSFGVQGGTDKSKYSFSLNYYEQDSFYKKGDYKRFTARFTNDYVFNKYISVGYMLNPRYENWGNPTNWADFDRVDPITPIYKAAEDLTGEENEYSVYSRSPSYVWNPVATVHRWNEDYKSYALSTSAYIQITPIKNLVFRSQGAFELDSRLYKKFAPDFVIDAAHEFQTNNKVTREQPMYRNWSVQNTLTYIFSLKDKHNFTAMLGNTLEEWNTNTFTGTKEKTPNNSDVLQELDAATGNATATGTLATTSVMSYLGRIMYNYDNKYYLTATYRADGSSKFMKKNKWASFPSASFAWRVSAEPFMQSTKEIINDLKVRVGWGQVGNQNLPAAVYMSKLGQNYYPIGGNPQNTTYPSAIKNEDIRWETVEDINAGIDFSLLQGKFSGSVEYYVKKTKNMLFQKAYPNYSGYPSDAKIWTNVGSMRSRGFDISLGYNDRCGDFEWGASFNLTTFNVEMTELTGDKEPLYGNSEKTKTIEGEAPGFFYGYVADGIFQNKTEINSHTNNKGEFLQPNAVPGDIRFKDVNGDGLLNASDRTKIGSPWADATMGLNLNFGYKNFDLIANLYASVGNDLVNQNKNELHNAVGKTNKVSGLINKAWHGEGTSNDIPRLASNDNNQNYSYFSSFYIEDGSYLRLKNLQLGYTFNKIPGLNKLRVYLSAQNLFTLTNYNGVDPEVSGSITSFGFGGWTYPVQRTYVMGVNVSF